MNVEKEYKKVLEEISDPDLISNWEKFEEVNKKKKALEEVMEKEKELKEIDKKLEENQSIITAEEDKDLMSLAEEETTQLQEKKKTLEAELKNLLKDPDRTKAPAAVIVEIRAGTGGDEAALFAGNLFNMYSKYAVSQNWKQKVLDSHATSLGGFKEIVFQLEGRDAFSQMRFEAGVHRVQRIPNTEKSGRVHTSTASVAVLAKPKKSDIKIKPDEIRVDTYRSSGPGGQYVNKRETAVRVTHMPTGIVVASQTERNQLQNKENAMGVLAAKILERQEEETNRAAGGKRNEQIGGAKRAEKIRTYNFPQDRVTDHRIKKSFHNIESIMDGKLEPIMKALGKNED